MMTRLKFVRHEILARTTNLEKEKKHSATASSTPKTNNRSTNQSGPLKKMASSLAAQLQRITATSTNTLNTQKLKQIHSASLLFPAAHAATQDLETIYSIAAEGFRELCQIDDRFIAYERGLFSESSKGVDRFLLPSSEVNELDRNIEGFLQLVSGKLLLRPALKAVEWLVRRFR